MRLKIRHNAEIAHRLSQSPGKCQQIHGHSLQIELVLMNLTQDPLTGMAKTTRGNLLDFSELKKTFRAYIDMGYDHHLLMNKSDPWARMFDLHDALDNDPVDGKRLPGLMVFPGDPTIENLAKWIAQWSSQTFETDVICKIEETKTNGAEVTSIYGRDAEVR